MFIFFILSYGIQTWHVGTYARHIMLILVSMTLTLMQGYSGFAEKNIQPSVISLTVSQFIF